MTAVNVDWRITAPVIAICGRPGSGKSTLAGKLAAALRNASVVEWDAFETMTQWPPEKVAEWLQNGGDVSVVRAPGLVDALEEACRKGPVLFEAPFGRLHPQSGRCITFAVWIDVDADLALARKLRQLMDAGADPKWLRVYLDAYEKIVQPSCVMQAERVAPMCNVRLTNKGSLDACVAHALELPQLAKLKA